MKYIITKIQTTLASKPKNAFLLFITGFFFSQFLLINSLLIKDPLGGWVTSIGNFSNASILFVMLSALAICLISLWRSVTKQEQSESKKAFKEAKVSIIKTQTNYSPIDYPRGSTKAVVSGYAVG